MTYVQYVQYVHEAVGIVCLCAYLYTYLVEYKVQHATFARYTVKKVPIDVVTVISICTCTAMYTEVHIHHSAEGRLTSEGNI